MYINYIYAINGKKSFEIFYFGRESLKIDDGKVVLKPIFPYMRVVLTELTRVFYIELYSLRCFQRAILYVLLCTIHHLNEIYNQRYMIYNGMNYKKIPI